jgi:hypothetical protein
MKKLILLSILTFCIGANSSFSQEWLLNLPKEKQNNYFEIQKSFNDYWSDKKIVRGNGYKQFKRIEYFFRDRIMPDGSSPDYYQIQKTWQDYKASIKNSNITQAQSDWKFIGPFNRPTGTGIGRVNCIFVDPNNDNTIYAGAAFGGLWKSTNGGSNWTSLLSNQFQSIGITSVAIPKSNSNIIYAGTGDGDAAGVFGSNWCYSIGLIKSTDGGNNWNETGFKSSLNQQYIIYKVLVNPTNPNLVYIATNVGFRKSTDGGNTFAVISPDGCRDIIMHATNPSVIFGVFYNNSIAGYEFRLFNDATNSLGVKGQVSGTSRIALAVSKAEPSSVWAIAVGHDMGFHSFWKSANIGETWAKTADKSNTPNICSFYTDGAAAGGQGPYDLCLAVSPTNANEVYIGAINVWKSTSSGSKWTCITDWTGSTRAYLHADQHSFYYNSTGHLYCGNDGGVSKTTNGGTGWIDLSDGLGISQFYKISTPKNNGNIIIGGTQDNGTMLSNGSSWDFVQPGDGMMAVIDQLEPNYVYASFYGNDGVINFTRSTDGGKSFPNVIINRTITKESSSWVAPIAIHPTANSTIFVGYQNIWKSTNRGTNWTVSSNFGTSSTIRAIVIAQSNPNYLYVTNGVSVYQSSNGGSAWKSIYTTPNAYITNIAVDPTNPLRLWFTFAGFNSGQKIVQWLNGTVTNMSGTLPNVPVNCVTYQNNTPDRLYIGTDVGVFTRDNTQLDWVPFNSLLPTVVVLDLNIHYGSGLLRAATYARGIWEAKVNDCNLASPSVKMIGDSSFCAGDSVILETQGIFSSYAWSSGEKTKSIIVKKSGKYYVTVTDANNCIASSREYSVTSNTIPDLKITASTADPFCEGDSITLQANLGFSTYKWSNGETTRRITVKQSGTFWVEGLTSAGCKDKSTDYTVTALPKPAKPTVTKNGDQLESSVADSYKWYLNGTEIANSNVKVYKPTKTGKYKVEIADSKGCKNTSDEVQYNYTSIELEPNNEFISLTPNPNTGEFEISLNNTSFKNIKFDIINSLGEVVYSGNQLTEKQSINISNHSNGLYFVRFSINNQIYTIKLMKI